MKVGIEWSAGGSPTLADGTTNPEFGKPIYLLISLLQLSLILLINRFVKGFLSNISVLIAMLAGFAAAWFLGDISLTGLNHEPWVAVIKPLSLGMPTFDFLAIVSMSLVMLVTMVESTGMFLALGKLVDKEVDQQQLVRGLRSDGLGTLLGGLFNAFPYTSFSQNIGLVTVSGVKSRYVTAADFTESRSNLLVVSASIGIGLIPMIAPAYFQHLPPWSSIFTDSGIILSVVTAIVLNAIFSQSTNPSS